MKNPYSNLQPYLPEGSIDILQPLLCEHPLELRIVKPRKTKFGDYRMPRNGNPHRISINANLNAYAFLITLVHELAHLQAFAQHGSKIKPHGPEWQRTFRQMSIPFLEASIFPENLQKALIKSLHKGHASSCTDSTLYRVLKNYNTPDATKPHVEDLPEGAIFALGKKVFKKGPKSRKRYKCQNISNKRYYMVHPLAEVDHTEKLKNAG